MALLVSACGFTEPKKFIMINENSDTSGNFLISTLIGQRLRVQNSGIILVCCSQSLKYYESCGRKLGYNLSMSINKKSTIVIEPLGELSKMSFESASNNKILEQTSDQIKDQITAFRSAGMKNVTLILDDVSLFTNLGYTENELINFGISLRELISQHNDEVSIILKLNLADLHQRLSNNFIDIADVSITTEKLTSGDFWDVDGKLIIKKMKCENGFVVTESNRSLLYHVKDHNVKLMAPGEIGLKF
jgi:hypothetical protein